jgi:hypothetical protein
MDWDRQRIIQSIRGLYRSGADLSYNAMCARRQALLSAAAYHFGSYRQAVEAASIAYEKVLRRPRWTRSIIVTLLKSAHRRGTNLCWSAVTRRRDELGRAAFASLQPRLFGRWDRALAAAGIDVAAVSRYRAWDRGAVISALRAHRRKREALSSGQMQSHDAALHAAAVRHFGSYEQSLRAAGIDPDSVRQRIAWSRAGVVTALRAAWRKGQHISDSAMRTKNPALYGACVRIFGRFTSARDAARLPFERRNGHAALPRVGRK